MGSVAKNFRTVKNGRLGRQPMAMNKVTELSLRFFNYKPLDSECIVYRFHEGRCRILFTVYPVPRTMLGAEKILNKYFLKE